MTPEQAVACEQGVVAFAKAIAWPSEELATLTRLLGCVNADEWYQFQPGECQYSGLTWMRVGPVGEVCLIKTEVTMLVAFAEYEPATQFSDIDFGIQLPDDFGVRDWDAIRKFLHFDEGLA